MAADWTHTFRKTAGALHDAGGLTVREIADQLGHRRVSVTQDTYFGRHEASPRVAAALEVIGGESEGIEGFRAGNVRVRPSRAGRAGDEPPRP